MPRPRKHLPPGAREYIMACAEQGALQETRICRALGLAFHTWRRILRDDEDAASLWEEAKATERDNLVSKLYDRAMEGDTNANRLLLAALHGLSEKAGTGDDSGSRVQINLPSPMSDAQYKRLFEQGSPAGAEHGAG